MADWVSMEQFKTFTGTAVPLRRSNVDTDQIIPAVYLKRVTKTGFEDALFAAWRHEPEFVLNQPRYQNSQILVAGPDFGVGSSREHAVWALRDYGFKVVVSPRFGDIFRGNSGKQGLLAAQVEVAQVEQLWALLENRPETPVTVDLYAQTIMTETLTVSFEVDGYTRWRLLEGLDDIDLTLRDELAISAFELERESWRPKTLPMRI